ncbi:MAG: LolA-related protein [Dokdonella sp.]
MTSGILKPLTLLSLLLLTWPCLAALPESSAPDAAALVAGLQRPVPSHTAYTEVHFASMFDRPVVVRGELDYLGPGKLGKRVNSPYSEVTTIADGEVSVVRGERKPRSISLSQIPELDGFLRGFTALLGGDAGVLRENFELKSNGSMDSWMLQLTPRDARLKRRIRSIDVYGSKNEARCFDVQDADGDSRVMLVERMSEAELPKPLSPQRLNLLCRSGIAAK